MIVSFKCKGTERLFGRERARKFPPDIIRTAQRKLEMLDKAAELMDLASPPGNRLEALKGARKGQHGIRINDQWRICFRWEAGNALKVEITDYH